ncbi:MAG: glycosyltransferase [Solirubrobacteraceae bacterium]
MRSTASVIVPFAGDGAQLAALGAVLAGLELGPGDEILIADNTGAAGQPALAPQITVLAAAGVRAPGYARNRAAAVAQGQWLVFLDADTVPIPGLLDAYLQPDPAPRTALLAGAIRDVAGGTGAASRHVVARGQMRDGATLRRAGRPYAQTANCAVRAAALTAVGGFDESARYGEDADLAFRLADAGWELEARPAALADHRSRPTLGRLLAQLSGHGTGAAWLARRHPAEFSAPSALAVARRCARSGLRGAGAVAHGERANAVAATLELLEALAFESGRLRSNAPRRR